MANTPASSTPLGGDVQAASRFLLEIDGAQVGVFRSVSGLSASIEPAKIIEGGQNGYTHMFPGRLQWPNLVFKGGLTDSDAMFAWLSRTSGEQFAANGNKLDRSTGSVVAIGFGNRRLRTWSFLDMFPVRWKGPDFDVESNAALEEELEVAHHGFTQTTGS